jgi:hypothetical protein
VNNSAAYGQNIASYPIKIRLQGKPDEQIKIENIGSDIQYDQKIYLALLDHDNQPMSLDDSSTIVIKTFDPNTSVKGTPEAKVYKGIAEFNNLILVAQPGSKNIKFEAVSKAIDSQKLLLQYESESIENKIDVSFRFCQPGEIEHLGTCKFCSAGSYSLFWNATK